MEPRGEEVEKMGSAVKIGSYLLKETLGEGAMGKVKEAVHERTGHRVAVKILSRATMKSMDIVQNLIKEIRLQQLFRHPHIVRLYQSLSTPTHIFMMMELVTGGELFSRILDKGRLAEDEARMYFQQMISAIDYCHRHKVVHRDLKPENILLDAANNVKICDFGLSAVLTDGGFLSTSCGSPNYASPELISGKMYAGPEVDIWSCGVILYAMLSAQLPFDHKNTAHLFQLIKRGHYKVPSYFSQGVRNLLAKIINTDPAQRATVRLYEGLREDEWFLKDLPAYLFLRVVATVTKLDIESIVAVAKETGCTETYVREAVRNGNPTDPIVVSYYTLVEMKPSSHYLSDEDGEDDEDRNDSSSTLTSVGKELESYYASDSASSTASAFSLAHSCASPSEKSRWCRENCELCPRWPGIKRCVYGRFLPDLGHCKTCALLNQTGCKHNAEVNSGVQAIEDLGELMRGMATGSLTGTTTTSPRTRLASSSDDTTTVSSSQAQASHGTVEEELGVVKAQVKMMQSRFKKAKWHLGIRSSSAPGDIMMEIFKVMRARDLEWIVITPFKARVRSRRTCPNKLSALVALFQLEGKGGYLLDFQSIPISHKPTALPETDSGSRIRIAEAVELAKAKVAQPETLSIRKAVPIEMADLQPPPLPPPPTATSEVQTRTGSTQAAQPKTLSIRKAVPIEMAGLQPPPLPPPPIATPEVHTAPSSLV